MPGAVRPAETLAVSGPDEERTPGSVACTRSYWWGTLALWAPPRARWARTRYFGLFCMTIFGLFQTQIW